MVDIWIPYGNTEICLRVPTENLISIVEPNEKIIATNTQAEVENALANPIGTRRLTEILKPGDKVAVVLKDLGQTTNEIVISSILKELNTGGANNRDITVIVAADPLQVSPPEKTDIQLSRDIISEIRITRHDSRTSEHVKVGETSQGTKVYLNKTFTEAKVKILAGSIEPHIYAGYSGGRDGILPGISGLETVQSNLVIALSPKSRRGIFRGNPVHEDMIEAAYLARVDFIFDIVRNARLEIVRAVAGDLDGAFEEGVKIVDDIFKIPIDGRADVAFSGAGGSPYDTTLFEVCKSMDSAIEATKRGGTIALAGECLQGLGSNEFYNTVSSFKDPDALERNLRKKMSIEGFIAHRLLKAIQRNDVFLVSAMPDYYVLESLRMRTARTANDALRSALDSVGRRGKVTVIPNGNMMMPLIKGGEETK